MLKRVLLYLACWALPAFAVNDLTGNPLVVDTASTTVPVWTAQAGRIQTIRWVGGTTAGHTAVVKDLAGHVKWAAVATAANYTDETDFWEPLTVKSQILVSTLSSGVLYIYLAP